MKHQLPSGAGPFLVTGNSANDGGGLVTVVLNPPNSDVLTPEPATAWLVGTALLGLFVGRFRFRGELPEQLQEVGRRQLFRPTLHTRN